MDYIERRKYPRIDIDFVTVEIYESDHLNSDSHVAEICNVENISEDGMRFTAEHQFYKKQLLRLTFLLPESIVIIRTDAVVAHIEKSHAHFNSIGVQFKMLKLAERKQICHFINKVLIEKSIQGS